MLDPWIIEEIIRREREEDERRREERRIELPLVDRPSGPRPQHDTSVPAPSPGDADRGVTVIDI